MRVRRAYRQWRVRAFCGLDRMELAAAFAGAKLHLEFGHHPGKGRLPREAARHGCCAITGHYGSAANALDVPTRDTYKLENRSPTFIADMGVAMARVYAVFEMVAATLMHARSFVARPNGFGHRYNRSSGSPE